MYERLCFWLVVKCVDRVLGNRNKLFVKYYNILILFLFVLYCVVNFDEFVWVFVVNIFFFSVILKVIWFVR